MFRLSQAAVQLIIEDKVPNYHFNSMVVPGTRGPRDTSNKPFDDNQVLVALNPLGTEVALKQLFDVTRSGLKSR